MDSQHTLERLPWRSVEHVEIAKVPFEVTVRDVNIGTETLTITHGGKASSEAGNSESFGCVRHMPRIKRFGMQKGYCVA